MRHHCLWTALLVSCILLYVECYEKDKYAIGLFAATALNQYGLRKQCMGKCYGSTKNTCRLNWGSGDEGTNCQVSHKFLTRRYTTYNHGDHTWLCMSDCSKFGGYSESWCVTEDTWFECTKEIPRKVQRKDATNSDYYHCLNGCDASKGWCYTYPSSWQYCKPSRTVYVTDNPTADGTRCVTRCGATSDSKLTFKCYDTKRKWVSCYPSPDASNVVKSFHQYASKHKSSLNSAGQLVSCDVYGRKRRDNDNYDVTLDEIDTLELEEIFNGVNTVEQMATLLEQWYPSETLRWPDPNVYPDPSEEPIIRYTVRVVPAVFGRPQVVLPMVMRAIYSNFTRATLGRSSRYDEANYVHQDPRPGLDDHGHLVQHALGGTEDAYNIVPQSTGLNRGGSWGYLERIMREYIQAHPRGTVEHTVVVNYDFTASYRPRSFAIRVRFYDQNRLPVNQYGQPLPGGSFANNIYENFYLINEDSPCG